MVDSTYNCIKCFKIEAGTKFKPGFWRILADLNRGSNSLNSISGSLNTSNPGSLNTSNPGSLNTSNPGSLTTSNPGSLNTSNPESLTTSNPECNHVQEHRLK